MNIDQLAARLAKLPRPNGWTDEDALEAWRTLLCATVDSGIQILDAATSYPVVRPEDVKRGEWYWAKAPSGEWLIRRPAYFNGGVYFTGFGVTDDPNAPSYKYKPVPAMKCEIRGPIPRPE